MKMLAILFLFLLVSPAYSQLTEDDLQTLKEELHIIVKQEITASEKRMEEYINLKIDAVNNKIDGLEKSLNARIDATHAQIDAVEKSLNVRIDATHAQIDAVEKSVNTPIATTNARVEGTHNLIGALNTRIEDVNSKYNNIWVVFVTLLGFPVLTNVYLERKRGQES